MNDDENIPYKGMSVRELINFSPAFGYVLEKMFKSLLEKDGVEFKAYDNLPREFKTHYYSPDFYLPSGWGKLGVKGKTFIDIKTRLRPNYIARYKRIFAALKESGKIENFVIVFYESDFPSDEKRVEVDGGFKVISFKMLSEKVDIHEINQKDEIEAPEENQVAQAKDAFNKGSVAIFLGAGVSASVGFPSWSELLQELMTKNLDIPGKDFDFISAQCFNSSIVTARYIKRLIYEHKTYASIDEFEDDFCSMVRDALYMNPIDVINAPLGKYPLINGIGEMIAKGRGQKKLVESIITYNYDTLIEDELARRKIDCFSIGKGDRWLNKDLPIYHVHGILYPPGSKTLNTEIVLSEEEYHKSYKEAYNWATVEQLHALRYKTCFFIGLSMSDPNLRRLLELSKDTIGERPPHYAFLQDQTSSDFYSEKNKNVLQVMMRSFGVNVIWYKEHKELPGILQQIYS